MSFTILSGIILLTMLLFVAWQGCRCYKLGFAKALTSLSLLLFSTLAGALIASLDPAVDEEIFGMLRAEGVVRTLSADRVALKVGVEFLLEMVISAFMMIAYTIALWIILGLVVRIARRASRKGAEEPRYSKSNGGYLEKNSAKLGLLVGIVAGLLLTVVVFTPLSAITRAADDTIEIIDKYTDGNSAKQTEVMKDIIGYSDDFMLTVVYSSGGKTLFDISTTFSAHGERTNLAKEIKEFESIKSSRVKSALGSIVTTGSGKNSYDKFIDDNEDSVIFDLLLVVTLKNSLNAWSQQETYMGMSEPAPTSSPVMRNLFRNTVNALHSTNIDTVRSDVEVLRSMNQLLSSKSDVYSGNSYDEQLYDLVHRGTDEDIEDILSYSPTTSDLIGLIDNAKISITVHWLDTAYAHEREDVYEIISNAWNQASEYYTAIDAKTAYVSAALAEAFSTIGMEVPNDICDDIVGRLAEMSQDNFNTIDQVENFFNSFL